jgi:hypothetical protein
MIGIPFRVVSDLGKLLAIPRIDTATWETFTRMYSARGEVFTDYGWLKLLDIDYQAEQARLYICVVSPGIPVGGIVNVHLIQG